MTDILILLLRLESTFIRTDFLQVRGGYNPMTTGCPKKSAGILHYILKYNEYKQSKMCSPIHVTLSHRGNIGLALIAYIL